MTSGVEAGSVGAYMTPMPAPPITELNDRARDVFRVVVDSYLNTGSPIGSRTSVNFRLSVEKAAKA